ncbi:MAG: DUF2141 domain-containing protein [Cellulophaga sp.]
MIIKNAVLALVLLLNLTTEDKSGSITIKIENLSNYNGFLQINVYNKNEGFPNKEKYAFKKFHFEIKDSSDNEFEIANLPYGIYAISVYHDENSNGKLDTNFFGIPKEKTGVSNNPSSDFMPSFSDAKFQLKASQKNLKIKLR